jgi:hypothetical protein
LNDVDERRRVGLCFTCRNARRVETPRSRFWMCLLAATDPRFDKYPRLPMRECAGYQRKEEGPPGEASGRN